MATGPRYVVKFRRRREGKTRYQKRVSLMKADAPKMVVRKSNKYILVQFSTYNVTGDKTLLTVTSAKLKGFGWNYGLKNIPAAYLTGLLAGKLAKKAKITRAISDIGLHSNTKGAKIFAVLKGAADSGLNIKLGAEVVPAAERIQGKHIAEHMKKPDITKDFESVKAKISSS
jgi:large subunit ribosomal protein L18